MDSCLLFNTLIERTEPKESNVLFLVESLYLNRGSLSSYKNKDLHAIFAYVKKCLGSGGDRRFHGLSVLGVLVERCTDSVFADMCNEWIDGLSKALTDENEATTRILAAEILDRVLGIASTCKEIAYAMTTTVMPKFLKLLIRNIMTMNKNAQDDHSEIVQLKVMQAVLRYQPGQCRPHVAVFLKKIVDHLDSADADVTDLATTCLALLPYVREDAMPKSYREQNWTKLFGQLCGSLHGALNIVYGGLESNRTLAMSPAEKLTLPSRTGTQADTQMSLFRQVVNCLIAMQKMLSTGGVDQPHPFLLVPVEDILALICRIVNVNGKALDKKGGKRYSGSVLAAFLPKFHLEAIQLTSALLRICRGQMALHSGTVLPIVLETLHWTSKPPSDADKSEHGWSLEHLRIAAYCVVVTWFESVSSSGCLVKHGSGLICHLLKDLALTEQSVQLVVSKGLPKSTVGRLPRAKKARMTFDAIPTGEYVHHTHRPFESSQLCVTALKTLKSIVLLGAENLKARSLRDVHHTVLKLVFQIQTAVDHPVPYVDPKCRRALYRLLLATVVHQHPLFAPELPTCIAVFSSGLLDAGHKVGHSCSEALAVCQLLTNPRRRSVQLALGAGGFPAVGTVTEEEEEEGEDLTDTGASAVTRPSPATGTRATGVGDVVPGVDTAVAVDGTPAVNQEDVQNGTRETEGLTAVGKVDDVVAPLQNGNGEKIDVCKGKDRLDEEDVGSAECAMQPFDLVDICSSPDHDIILEDSSSTVSECEGVEVSSRRDQENAGVEVEVCKEHASLKELCPETTEIALGESSEVAEEMLLSFVDSQPDGHN